MRLVVAGGAGFIGHRMCARLLERGAEVVCVDNLLTGAYENIEGLVDHPGFSFVEADITQQVPVTGRIDAVVNLASPASPVDFGPLALEILNVAPGAAGYVELARLHGAADPPGLDEQVYGEPLVHRSRKRTGQRQPDRGPIGLRRGQAVCRSAHLRIPPSPWPRGPGGEDFQHLRTGMRPDYGRIVSTFVTEGSATSPSPSTTMDRRPAASASWTTRWTACSRCWPPTSPRPVRRRERGRTPRRRPRPPRPPAGWIEVRDRLRRPSPRRPVPGQVVAPI